MAKIVRVLQAEGSSRFRKAVCRFLKGREDLLYLGGVDNGKAVLAAIEETRPHVVLLDFFLKPQGGLNILHGIRERWQGGELGVIMLSSATVSEYLLHKAAELGANYCLERPVDLGVLVQRILQLSSDSPWFFERELSEEEVKALSRRYFELLGIPPHYKGYRYLIEGIWLVCIYPSWLNSVTRNLYPAIGNRFAAGGAQVERAMRYALEVTWEKGNIEQLYRLFPYEIQENKGKPTNSAFIAKMSNLILLELNAD